MKKIYLLLFCPSFLVGNAQTYWLRSQATSTYPTWMGTDTERGTAYNATNDHMYVVTRLGNKIKVINSSTGADLADVSDYTGVSGGTFILNDVEVSANGAILAANMTTNSTTSAFKIYKWDNETATPTVYISYTGLAERLGDTFTVSGDISNNAVIFANGRGTANIVRWVVTGGVLGAPTVITLANAQGNISLAYPKDVDAGAASKILVNSTGNPLRLYNADGTYAGEEVSNTVLANSASDFKYFVLGGKEYIASYVAIAEDTALIDVTGGLGNAVTVTRSPKLGSVSNGNQAGGVGVKTEVDPVDGLNTITVFTLGTNNGISGTTLVYQGVTLDNKKFDLSESKIFPNPVTNEFQITLSHAIEKNAEAIIYDINGRQVKSSKLLSKTQSISTENLSKGLYVVQVKNGNNQSVIKLVKN